MGDMYERLNKCWSKGPTTDHYTHIVEVLSTKVGRDMVRDHIVSLMEDYLEDFDAINGLDDAVSRHIQYGGPNHGMVQ